MANYYCSSRTNYFRVKDRAAFNAFAKKIGAEVIEDDSPDGDKRVGLLPGDDDDGGFRSYDPDTEEDFDLLGEITAHLAEGSVAVLIEAGALKLSYIHGYAIAVRSDGTRVEIRLSDIYELATARLGGEVTQAEY